MVHNNRRRAFEITIGRGGFAFPYAKADPSPGPGDSVIETSIDSEIGREGFTFLLQSGKQGTVLVEQVLEYNEEPDYMRDLLLYKLTVETRERLEASRLSKRELIRKLGTSPAQLYRLLDTTNYRKTIDKMLSLLQALDCEVDLVVRDKARS